MSTFNIDGVTVDIPGVVIEADAYDIAGYIALDGLVDKAEGDGIMARWEFGQRLLAEREANGGKQLPHGRLDEVCAATGKSRSEVQYRMQFAERYRTRGEVSTVVDTFGSWTDVRDDLSSRGNGSQVSNNSGDIEWFTPADYIEAARALMGSIDLDPASTAEANEVVKAEAFYTKADNGLELPWSGRVWMNPPYAGDVILPFCRRLIDFYAAGDVTQAVALVNSATETEWFHTLASQATAICFPRRRIKFWHPAKPGDIGPLQGQAVFYMGDQADTFRHVFGDFGFTVTL